MKISPIVSIAERSLKRSTRGLRQIAGRPVDSTILIASFPAARGNDNPPMRRSIYSLSLVSPDPLWIIGSPTGEVYGTPCRLFRRSSLSNGIKDVDNGD